MRPFLLESPSQFRTPGPNSLGSAAWAADFNEVKALGSAGSLVRTATQTHNALFWQSNGGPALLWNDVASDLVESSGSIDLRNSARLLGMLNLAGADAAINCWNDKYHYDFWRPWNAIVNDGDGTTYRRLTLADVEGPIVVAYRDHESECHL